jgi:hypothetical protein
LPFTIWNALIISIKTNGKPALVKIADLSKSGFGSQAQLSEAEEKLERPSPAKYELLQYNGSRAGYVE